MSSPIERYLDELRRRTPRRTRARLLDEVREHLLDNAASLREAGLDEAAAEARAVERLGGPLVVANTRRRLDLVPAMGIVSLTAALAGVGGFVLAESVRTGAHPISAGRIVAAPGWSIASCGSDRVGTIVAIDSRTGRVVMMGRTDHIVFSSSGAGKPVAKLVTVVQTDPEPGRLRLLSVADGCTAP